MELVTPDHRDHRWLRWAGLKSPPPAAETWVPVVRGLEIDDPQTASSDDGQRLVDLLAQAGIDAAQRGCQFEEPARGMFGMVAGGGPLVSHVAVVVHNRQRDAAALIAAELNIALEREAAAAAITDEELTRLALGEQQAP